MPNPLPAAAGLFPLPANASSSNALSHRAFPGRTSGAADCRSSRRRTAAASHRSAPVQCEPLEDRCMMSVTHNTAGATIVGPASDSRIIYVSSSQGKDTNSGLSASSPVKSLAKGASLVRGGSADQLLLKRGDTWHASFGYWLKSGRSASNPLLISGYGTGSRPTIASGSQDGFATGRTNAQDISNIDLIGLHFIADSRSTSKGGDGLRLTARSSGMLVEDCVIENYVNNIAANGYFGSINNLTIRRSQILNSYAVGQNSEGLFVYNANNITLEQNVFDHNGWGHGTAPTIYNHNIYIRDNTSGVVVRNNVISNAAAHGLEARSGGLIENNTFINNPNQLSFGVVNGSPVKAGGVSGAILNNTFTGGGTINGQKACWGIEIGNVRKGGTVVSGNTFSHGGGGFGFAFYLYAGTGVTNPQQAVGINDLTITNNNIIDWCRGVCIGAGLHPGSGANALNNVTIKNNTFQHLAQSPYVLQSTAVSMSNNIVK